MEQIAKSLAEKGHQVDVVSGFSLDEPFPNYTEIVQVPNPKKHEGGPWEEIRDRNLIWNVVHNASQMMCEYLGIPELNELIKNPPKDRPYDLVITQVKKKELLSSP